MMLSLSDTKQTDELVDLPDDVGATKQKASAKPVLGGKVSFLKLVSADATQLTRVARAISTVVQQLRHFEYRLVEKAFWMWRRVDLIVACTQHAEQLETSVVERMGELQRERWSVTFQRQGKLDASLPPSKPRPAAGRPQLNLPARPGPAELPALRATSEDGIPCPEKPESNRSDDAIQDDGIHALMESLLADAAREAERPETVRVFTSSFFFVGRTSSFLISVATRLAPHTQPNAHPSLFAGTTTARTTSTPALEKKRAISFSRSCPPNSSARTRKVGGVLTTAVVASQPQRGSTVPGSSTQPRGVARRAVAILQLFLQPGAGTPDADEQRLFRRTSLVPDGGAPARIEASTETGRRTASRRRRQSQEPLEHADHVRVSCWMRRRHRSCTLDVETAAEPYRLGCDSARSGATFILVELVLIAEFTGHARARAVFRRTQKEPLLNVLLSAIMAARAFPLANEEMRWACVVRCALCCVLGSAVVTRNLFWRRVVAAAMRSGLQRASGNTPGHGGIFFCNFLFCFHAGRPTWET